MSRKPPTSFFDDDDFMEEMANVRPLKGQKKVRDTGVDDLSETDAPPPPPKPKTAPAKPFEAPKAPDITALDFEISHHEHWRLEGYRPGVDPKLRRELARGEREYTRRFDLHGYRLLEAQHALKHFLTTSWEQGHRCVLVVHGKGGHADGGMGAIKNNFRHWLEKLPFVLAYHTAIPRHGGDGASYVLLRRYRKEETER